MVTGSLFYSQFVCKKCNDTRLSEKALAPLRGRCMNYKNENPHDKEPAAEDPGLVESAKQKLYYYLGW